MTCFIGARMWGAGRSGILSWGYIAGVGSRDSGLGQMGLESGIVNTFSKENE